jgi:hypothetical protein
MSLRPKVIVYIVAALALLTGIVAYALSEGEEEHDDEGLVAGDTVKVVVAISALALVAVVSFAYLARAPPGGV